MTEFVAHGITLPQAYHKALRELQMMGELTECPDYNTKQRELSMTMVVEKPLKEPMISKLFIGGFRELEQYRQEMLDGILDFEVERGNWAYTYHQRYAPYIDYCINELRRDPNSRRAVISVRDNEADTRTDDPACLQSISFRLRNGKLACAAVFRSNDAVKAAFMNMFALVCLQERVANELGVEVGEYTHVAFSYHVYSQDYALLDGYVRRLSADPNSTYNYKGEFDEMMEEFKDDIAALVEKLKSLPIKQTAQPQSEEKKRRFKMFKRSCEDSHTVYVDFSFIRFVFRDGKYVGWYRP
jgi:thymidylate synthase